MVSVASCKLHWWFVVNSVFQKILSKLGDELLAQYSYFSESRAYTQKFKKQSKTKTKKSKTSKLEWPIVSKFLKKVHATQDCGKSRMECFVTMVSLFCSVHLSVKNKFFLIQFQGSTLSHYHIKLFL